ncbi:RNA-binding protein 6-like [Protopterus annectens]|uniref:RNA-binding protein 6-like n=1 Tax=Protopterus annectens TaxID=7888 RepID=UPI001CFAE4B7|nr:RNA-binding protein 6-like [Protopterus annectens]
MWDGSNFSGGGMGPHRGMPERSIRDWRREVLPPRELQMLDRHPADFPGRQPPSGFQGRGDSFGMQLEHIERERGPPFEMGPRRGPSFGPRNMRGIEDALLDFMGGDAHVSIVRGRPGMDLRGRDMPARDFGMQNQPFVEQRGWDGPAAEYRGRDVQPHNFRDFGPPSPEFRGPDMTSLDFRARDATPGGYRGRDISPGSYGGQDIPSDFRGRSFPSEFRGRDASSQEFRRWEGPRSEFSGNEAPSSEYRGRDVSSHDFRDVTHEARRSTPPHEFGDHDASHSSRAVDKLASEEDKDLSKTQTVDSLDSERNLSDYRVSGVSATDLPERERSPINTSGIDATDSDFRNHERLSSDFSADDMHSDTVASAETSIGTESREQPVLDSRNRGASSSSDSKLEEQTSGLSECSGKREESLEFLGREDADYRGRNYQDVDLRVPGMFDYRHGKSSDDPTKSDLDLKDQDYRTSSRDEKKSTCIMIDGLPRKATANDVLNAFKNPDGSTMSGFRLANLSTGENHLLLPATFSPWF